MDYTFYDKSCYISCNKKDCVTLKGDKLLV